MKTHTEDDTSLLFERENNRCRLTRITATKITNVGNKKMIISVNNDVEYRQDMEELITNIQIIHHNIGNSTMIIQCF